ncbi:MAG: SusC/RagA family TonB-linked outer membrane protein, partial [Cyclobacteriaceae bacterium]
FDLNISFRGLGDVQKVFSEGKRSIDGGGTNYLSTYLNRWTPENPSNTIPRALHGDPSGNNRFSDRFVEDAGFLRFQNFQLGYNFSGDILSRVGFSNLRTFISGSNLFVLSPYTDLDPEDNTTPTTFTFGVNLGF